jgi:hypothetical protein
MIWRYRFVHCVPVRIREGCGTVAVHAWSSLRAEDEVCGVGQGKTEVDVEVGRVCLDPERSLSSTGTVVVTASCYSHQIASVEAWCGAEHEPTEGEEDRVENLDLVGEGRERGHRNEQDENSLYLRIRYAHPSSQALRNSMLLLTNRLRPESRSSRIRLSQMYHRFPSGPIVECSSSPSSNIEAICLRGYCPPSLWIGWLP